MRVWVPVLALVVMSAAGEARPGNLVILQEWRGRVDDTPSTLPAYAADQKTLARVWAMLRIPEKMPSIDFRERLALVVAVRSSLVQMRPQLDDAGNLSRNVVATPDQPAFKSYVVALVSRDGVKTVDGQAVSE